jgi:hypothetical protein
MIDGLCKKPTGVKALWLRGIQGMFPEVAADHATGYSAYRSIDAPAQS